MLGCFNFIFSDDLNNENSNVLCVNLCKYDVTIPKVNICLRPDGYVIRCFDSDVAVFLSALCAEQLLFCCPLPSVFNIVDTDSWTYKCNGKMVSRKISKLSDTHVINIINYLKNIIVRFTEGLPGFLDKKEILDGALRDFKIYQRFRKEAERRKFKKPEVRKIPFERRILDM